MTLHQCAAFTTGRYVLISVYKLMHHIGSEGDSMSVFLFDLVCEDNNRSSWVPYPEAARAIS